MNLKTFGWTTLRLARFNDFSARFTMCCCLGRQWSVVSPPSAVLLRRTGRQLRVGRNGPRTTDKLVIFVDELDVVRSLSFSTDEFFAAIRECYTRRAEDPEFRRLTFCLLGVATPSDLIRDTRITPFNIGRRIELNDFTPQEAAPLAKGLVSPKSKVQGPKSPARPDSDLGPGNSELLLGRILYWTHGHPYLTQRLCQV